MHLYGHMLRPFERDARTVPTAHSCAAAIRAEQGFNTRASASYESSYENAENARETLEYAFEVTGAPVRPTGWNRWKRNEKNAAHDWTAFEAGGAAGN